MGIWNPVVQTRVHVASQDLKTAVRRDAGAIERVTARRFPFPRNLRHREAAKRENSRSRWWLAYRIGGFR